MSLTKLRLEISESRFQLNVKLDKSSERTFAWLSTIDIKSGQVDNGYSNEGTSISRHNETSKVDVCHNLQEMELSPAVFLAFRNYKRKDEEEPQNEIGSFPVETAGDVTTLGPIVSIFVSFLTFLFLFFFFFLFLFYFFFFEFFFEISNFRFVSFMEAFESEAFQHFWRQFVSSESD